MFGFCASVNAIMLGEAVCLGFGGADCVSSAITVAALSALHKVSCSDLDWDCLKEESSTTCSKVGLPTEDRPLPQTLHLTYLMGL